jgi:hypothetical protein
MRRFIADEIRGVREAIQIELFQDHTDPSLLTNGMAADWSTAARCVGSVIALRMTLWRR